MQLFNRLFWSYKSVSAVLLLLFSASLVANDFVQAHRYNATGQKTGTINADPDGSDALGYPAVRYRYNSVGLLFSEESGVLNGASLPGESVAPDNWSNFTVHLKTTYRYDDYGRQIQVMVYSGSDIISRKDMNYDSLGRLNCEAVRMDSTRFHSQLNLDACSLMVNEASDIEADQTLDRITQYAYNSLDNIKSITKALNTSLEQTYAEYEYLYGAHRTAVIDANGNRTEFKLDVHLRPYRWIFSSKTNTGITDTSDYEEYHYDANGNRTYLRKRDAKVISFTFDKLNQVTLKDVPEAGKDVYYGYDNRGLQTYSRFGGATGLGITTTYDGFGLIKNSINNASGTSRQLSYKYDARGNRIRVTHPDSIAFYYDYDGLDRFTDIRVNSETAATVITQQYNDSALPSGLSRTASGASTAYEYDDAYRLEVLSHDFVQSANDVSITFGYNPANQVLERTYSNTTYIPARSDTLTGGYAVNGLNQYTCQGNNVINCSSADQIKYDDNGNLTDFAGAKYTFDSENRLINITQPVNTQLLYDPAGRLNRVIQGSNTYSFLYDGDALVAEYLNGTLQNRYLHSTSVDSPLISYAGSGVANTNRQYLHRDHQGSIIALSDKDGALVTKNVYDEFGIPGDNNQGRFAYTGQIILPNLDIYHYKARVYHPKLGRFLQTDPVGYEDQMNLYAYVGNDPVTYLDPNGRTMLNMFEAWNTGWRSSGNKAAKDLEATGELLVHVTESLPYNEMSTVAAFHPKGYAVAMILGGLDTYFNQDLSAATGATTSQIMTMVLTDFLEVAGKPLSERREVTIYGISQAVGAITSLPEQTFGTNTQSSEQQDDKFKRTNVSEGIWDCSSARAAFGLTACDK